MFKIDQLRYADCVQVEGGRSGSFHEITNDVIVVSVVESALGKAARLIPHDSRSQCQKWAIINEVDAIRFSKKVKGAAILQFIRENSYQIEVVLLNVRYPVPFVRGDTVRTISDNEIDAIAREAVEKFNRVSLINSVRIHV